MIKIDAKTLMQGESSSDYASDRGFSPNSRGLNLTKNKGMLYFMETPTAIGAAVLTGNIVATAKDPAYLGFEAVFVDDEGAFYTLNGSTLAKTGTTGHTFAIGTTDLIAFNNEFYATSQDTVVKLNNVFAISDAGWWSFSNSIGYRHPLERVEDEMFIGDKNLIHVWNGTTSTNAAITLPDDVNATTLRKHPDGRHLIAFCGTTADFSHTKGNGGKIYIIDPVIRDWIREIDIESQVEGSKMVGGTIYVTYGPNVGYFNGNGITFLKKLLTNTKTYNHQISNWEEKLLVADGRNVRAYGDLGLGNVWWSIYRNQNNTSSVNCVQYYGDNQVLFAYGPDTAGGLEQVDYDNAGTVGEFYSNRYDFNELTRIRKMEVIHDQTNGAGTSRFILYQNDLENNVNIIHDANYLNQTVTKTRFQCNVEDDIFQLNLLPQNDDLGYKLIRIHHEPIK